MSDISLGNNFKITVSKLTKIIKINFPIVEILFITKTNLDKVILMTELPQWRNKFSWIVD